MKIIGVSMESVFPIIKLFVVIDTSHNKTYILSSLCTQRKEEKLPQAIQQKTLKIYLSA